MKLNETKGEKTMTQQINLNQIKISGAKALTAMVNSENVNETQIDYLCESVAQFIINLQINTPPKLTSDLFSDYMAAVYLILEDRHSDINLHTYGKFCAYWHYVLFEVGIDKI